MMLSTADPFFVGMTVNELAAVAGETRHKVDHWLRTNGYEVNRDNRKIRRAKPLWQREDEIAARVAAAPPSQPCWRCGCRACEHQGGNNTFQQFGDVAARVVEAARLKIEDAA